MSFWSTLSSPLAYAANPLLGQAGTAGKMIFPDSPAAPGGDPYAGMPASAAYTPGYDPKTMSVSDPQTSPWAQEALRKGPSQWANLATLDQAKQAEKQRDVGAQTVAGQNAGAMDRLAAQGGLSSGARERVAESGARNALTMNQDVSRQAGLNKMQIGINDEQNRINQLGQWQQAKQYDIGQGVAENERRNSYNQNLADKRQQIWAANQQAQAVQQAAPSGGMLGSSFICTALRTHGLMSKRETIAMTRLMLHALVPRADFFAWYFRKGEKAIELAERQNFDWSKVKRHFVDEILETAEHFGEEIATSLYIERAGQFVTQFLGDQAKFPRSSVEPGRWKGLLHLPRVFTLPGTWRWCRGYFLPRFKKYGVATTLRRAFG